MKTADIRLELKIDQFNAAMKDMADKLRDVTTQREVISYEVGRVLERAIAKTKAATVSSITQSAYSQPWTTYQGKRYRLDWKMPDALWAGITEMRKASLARKIAAIGLTKQSWFAIGQKLGIYDKMKVPAYVKTAHTPNHNSAENVTTAERSSDAGFGIAIANNSPLLGIPGMRAPFFAAVAGRIGFYNQNVKHGVFMDLDAVAKKYRGLRINNPSPPPDPPDDN